MEKFKAKTFEEFMAGPSGNQVSEGIDKDTILQAQDWDSDMLNDIENGYYGIVDHLDTLVQDLENTAAEHPDWKEEVKIFKQIQKLFNKSKIGKFL